MFKNTDTVKNKKNPSITYRRLDYVFKFEVNNNKGIGKTDVIELYRVP